MEIKPWVPVDFGFPPPGEEVYIFVVTQWGLVVRFGTTTGEYNHRGQQWEIAPQDVLNYPQMRPLLWTPILGDTPPETPGSEYVMPLANKYKPVAPRGIAVRDPNHAGDPEFNQMMRDIYSQVGDDLAEENQGTVERIARILGAEVEDDA